MAYDLKDTFYLTTSLSTGTSANDQAAALDLSSYIDPIARKGSKAQGLAVYRVSMSFRQGSNVVDKAEDGSTKIGIIAGSGLVAGTVSITDNTILTPSNDLCIAAYDYYGPATADSTLNGFNVTPTEKVPYVIVRDNLNLICSTDDAFAASVDIDVRLECAVVTLDQATLNQLLRTQTV
jgi:hypothetical protein